MLAFYNRWLPVLDLPVPVLAVLQGDCIGAAPVFACAADIAFADETLKLQIMFAGLGLCPGMALPTLLTRKVGPYRASLLTMANEIVTGREAEQIGLVERCVPAGAAYEEALKTARAIGASAPSIVRLLKEKPWDQEDGSHRRTRNERRTAGKRFPDRRGSQEGSELPSRSLRLSRRMLTSEVEAPVGPVPSRVISSPSDRDLAKLREQASEMCKRRNGC